MQLLWEEQHEVDVVPYQAAREESYLLGAHHSGKDRA
jgi:hypothetical protein